MKAGNIPAELSQLSSLQRLYLSNNNLSGKRFIIASSNNMKLGNIPAELSQLSNLHTLYNNHNKLSGNAFFNIFASLSLFDSSRESSC